MNTAMIRPMPSTVLPLPDGDAGTAATIGQMWKLIAQGKKSPLVREAAVSIIQVAQVRAHDHVGEARALFNWALRSIRFTRDIRGRETLHSADQLLRLGAGDCDDFTVLILSLAQSLGAEARIVTISHLPPDPATGAPAEFTHVFPEVMAGGRWIALDCARKNPAFGRRPARCSRWQIWDDPSEDEAGVEFLNFYVGPNPTIGSRSRPIQRSLSGGWSAPPKMASVARTQSYNPAPRKAARQPGRRMGQDWSSLIAPLISTAGQTTTEIIAASKGAATSAPSVSTGVAPSAYAYPFAGGPGVAASGSILGISSTTLILGALGIGLLMFMGNRNR